ncbi:uncharacterized protein LOC142322883 [Lycorma delicatula]|uniref:uncharacterized protein LOC142322883 n=1 Tax=Lycorma delicatula TaxID=130591 RepID=UPI003F514EBA
MKRDLKDQFNVTDITDEIQNNKVDYELQDERHVKNAMLELSNDELSDGNIKANKEGGGNIPFLQGTGNEPNVDSGNIPLLPGGSIPQLPTGGNTDGNKEGSIPFLPGGNLPQFPGGLINSVGQGMSQTPKLVWGGFFFVETPMPGASLSNIANMASLMQGGQQMIPGGGLPTQMIPIPGAG